MIRRAAWDTSSPPPLPPLEGACRRLGPGKMSDSDEDVRFHACPPVHHAFTTSPVLTELALELLEPAAALSARFPVLVFKQPRALSDPFPLMYRGGLAAACRGACLGLTPRCRVATVRAEPDQKVQEEEEGEEEEEGGAGSRGARARAGRGCQGRAGSPPGEAEHRPGARRGGGRAGDPGREDCQCRRAQSAHARGESREPSARARAIAIKPTCFA